MISGLSDRLSATRDHRLGPGDVSFVAKLRGQRAIATHQVPVGNIGSVGITTSYQFDLFGTLQRGIESAQAGADAAQAAADIARINPNTRTAPVFRSRADADLTRRIYARVPVFIDEAAGKTGNPWGISFMRLFDMSNDSGLFRTAKQLAEEFSVRAEQVRKWKSLDNWQADLDAQKPKRKRGGQPAIKMPWARARSRMTASMPASSKAARPSGVN